MTGIVYELHRLVAPAIHPISLAQAKDACRVLHDDEDAFLEMLIDAAHDLLDGPNGYLGRAIMLQDWRLTVPARAVGSVALPLSPVSQILAIRVHDGVGWVEEQLSDYQNCLYDFHGHVFPTSGLWPGMADRGDSIQIDFRAGRVEAPPRVKAAMSFMVSDWYMHRESSDFGAAFKSADTSKLLASVEGLLSNERQLL